MDCLTTDVVDMVEIGTYGNIYIYFKRGGWIIAEKENLNYINMDHVIREFIEECVEIADEKQRVFIP